jgi:hypothetical protein
MPEHSRSVRGLAPPRARVAFDVLAAPESPAWTPASSTPTCVDDLAPERDGLLGVMQVARAILEAEDVAGLGDMGEQGVVVRISGHRPAVEKSRLFR